jgi:hypothetical protein
MLLMGRKSRLKRERKLAEVKIESEQKKKGFLRRSLLPLSLVVGLGLSGLGIYRWQAHHQTDASPLSMESKSLKSKKPITQKSGKDPNYERFKHIFSDSPLTYEETSKRIEEITGEKIKEYQFSAPDKYGFTKTDSFYFFDFIPAHFPIMHEGRVQLGKIPRVIRGKYHTYLKNKNDGRLIALANYILTKNHCSGPKDAIKAITEWVMQNIKMHFEYSSLPGLMHNKNIHKKLRETGFGISRAHSNSLRVLERGGVCVDFVNLAADLLNSIGIPSRQISVSANGLKRGASHLSSRRDVSKQTGLAHSILEVNLSSKLFYFDITPTRDPGGINRTPRRITNDLNKYVSQSFIDSFPGAKLSSITCIGSITSKIMSKYPKILAVIKEKDPLVAGKQTLTKEFSKSYQEFATRWWKHYVLFYGDRYLPKEKPKQWN